MVNARWFSAWRAVTARHGRESSCFGWWIRWVVCPHCALIHNGQIDPHKGPDRLVKYALPLTHPHPHPHPPASKGGDDIPFDEWDRHHTRCSEWRELTRQDG